MNVVGFAGLDVLTRTNQTNSATIFILLKPWEERGARRADRCDHQADQRQALRHEGRRRLRVQPARDPRPGRHRGRRGQSPESVRQGRPRLRAVQVQAFTAAVNKLPAVQGMTTHVPRQRAAGVRRRGPRDGQGARGESDRPVQYAADVPVHALHQRLQPVRPDLSGAGGGAASSSAGRPRTSAGCTCGGADDEMVPVSSLVQHRVPERPHPAAPVQRVSVRALHRHAQAGTELAVRCMKEIDSRGRTEFAPQGVGVGYSGSVVPGARRHRTGGPRLRARSRDRVPGAGGAVRELVHPLRGALRRALRRAGRAARRSGCAACRATSTSRSA